MSAVSKLYTNQFPNMNGLQDTTLVPYFCSSSKTWNFDKTFLRQGAPCVQIHFDGSAHWTTSLRSEKDSDSVYYLVSLDANSKILKTNIQIQLSQIYSCKLSKLNIKIPRVQQQPNSNDCGLFAIANAVEFCHNQSSLNFCSSFIVLEMRERLVYSLENGTAKWPPFLEKIKITICCIWWYP